MEPTDTKDVHVVDISSEDGIDVEHLSPSSLLRPATDLTGQKLDLKRGFFTDDPEPTKYQVDEKEVDSHKKGQFIHPHHHDHRHHRHRKTKRQPSKTSAGEGNDSKRFSLPQDETIDCDIETGLNDDSSGDPVDARYQVGSDVELNLSHKPFSDEDSDEINALGEADRDAINSHRYENVPNISSTHMQKRKSKRKRKSERRRSSIAKTLRESFVKFSRGNTIINEIKTHEMFVELAELKADDDQIWTWHERARWIKYEEDVEEGNHWGKPHVASLTFHSLLELRHCIEKGAVCLDVEEHDLPSIANFMVNQFILTQQLPAELKDAVMQALLLKHTHQEDSTAHLRRNFSQIVLRGNLHKLKHAPKQSSNQLYAPLEKNMTSADRDWSDVEMAGCPRKPSISKPRMRTTSEHMSGITMSYSLKDLTKSDEIVSGIAKRIPKDAEATTVLVGSLDFLTKPIMAFVRLSSGCYLSNVTEAQVPVRFIFLVMGPPSISLNYYEIGRSISTLMSSSTFNRLAYKARGRDDLLDAINDFLNDSMVLPPGDWNEKTLLPILKKHRKTIEEKEKVEEDEDARDPFKRTGKPFGGLWDDIRLRYPRYWSDIKDGLNVQCFAAFFFVYCACLAPAITIGGLLSEKVDGWIGVSESLFGMCLFGVIFALFSGQPIVVVGTTGPKLVFEAALFKICASMDIPYMSLRLWIGIWIMVLTAITVAFELNFLVKYFTRFVEDIFSLLISLIFIAETVYKLKKIFKYNPLQPCPIFDELFEFLPANPTNFSSDSFNASHGYNNHYGQPNTALFSLGLIIGTFIIAIKLKDLRNSSFLGRTARRAIGDFGLPIAIGVMVLVDAFVDGVYTEKLVVPEGLRPTRDDRGWLIDPFHSDGKHLPIWGCFLAAIPALLLFILIFVETEITGLIINKKDRRLKKGSGFHLDLFIIGIISVIGGVFGLPFVAAGSVRSITHLSALSVFSRTHAPGEKPKLLEVKEQRVTGFLVHAMIGVSILMSPLLRQVPIAVLFGVFVYMGVVSLHGVQMVDRLKMLFMPSKHHPDVGFVKKVRTWKMHLYTLIQLLALVGLWFVKSTSAALAFPFLITLLVPVRFHLLPYLFSDKELHELDNEEDVTDENEDEPDFYEQTHIPL